MIDLALWINGDISSVNAHMASFSERTDPDGLAVSSASESALLTVEFIDGAQGMIHAISIAHIAARGSEHSVTLHGAAGTLGLEWCREEGPAKGVIRGCRHDEREYQTLTVPDEYLQGTEASDIITIFQNHLIGPRLFVDAILRDYQPEPSFAQGVKVQQVLDVALESHETGRRVPIAM